MPFSRTTDPETSRLAAASVADVTSSQAHILALLIAKGPLSDQTLIDLYGQMAAAGDYPKLSDSGIRTRRCELVTQGRVVDSGDRGRTGAGRATILWAAR